MKKKGFWRFFVKRFIIALIIWAAVVGIIGAGCYGIILSEQMNLANSNFDNVLSSIQSLEDNDVNMFKIYLEGMQLPEDKMDIAFAVLNRDTGEIIYSDGIFSYLVTNEKEIKGKTYETGYYYNDCEELREYVEQDFKQYEETYKEYEYLDIYMDINFDKVYLKDRSFVSNKAEVNYIVSEISDSNEEILCKETKTYDLKLPDNLDEYTLDNDFKEATIGYAWWYGSEPNSKAFEELKASREKNDFGHYDFNLIEGRADHFMPFEHLGTKYALLSTTKFELWSKFGNELIYPSILFFLFLLAFVVLFSIVFYLRYKKKYEMYLYRVEMTNTLAHDLKSPLTAISGYAENLCSNVHTEKKDYYANAILDNTKYMNDIIDNVLELSKVEVGKTKLEKSEFNIIELAESLCAKYKPQLNDKKIKLNLSGNAVINADKNKITQAVENLISNAVKYTDEGGEITVTANSKSFKVSNTCKDAEKLNFKEIVKPFIKGDNSRSGRKGTGLGLAIVKNIAELSGYKFKVYNDNGNFTVEIGF